MKIMWKELALIEDNNSKVNRNHNAGNNKKDNIFIHKMSSFAFSDSPDINNQRQNSASDIKMKKCHGFVLDKLDTFIARLKNTAVMAMPVINVNHGILVTAPGINTPTTSDANTSLALSKKNSESKSIQSLRSILYNSTIQSAFCQGAGVGFSRSGLDLGYVIASPEGAKQSQTIRLLRSLRSLAMTVGDWLSNQRRLPRQSGRCLGAKAEPVIRMKRELTQMIKLVDTKLNIVEDFMVRNRQNRFNILLFHDYMAGSMTAYSPACSLEDFYCFSARAVARKLWHLYCNLTEYMISIASFISFSALVKNFKTALHSIFDIFKRLLFCAALRNASGNCWAFSDISTYFARFNYNFVFHKSLPPVQSIAYGEIAVKDFSGLIDELRHFLPNKLGWRVLPNKLGNYSTVF